MPAATYVACGEGRRVVGTYYIKPNQSVSGLTFANAATWLPLKHKVKVLPPRCVSIRRWSQCLWAFELCSSIWSCVPTNAPSVSGKGLVSRWLVRFHTPSITNAWGMSMRRLCSKSWQLNRVTRGVQPLAPIPPTMRVRTRWFTKARCAGMLRRIVLCAHEHRGTIMHPVDGSITACCFSRSVPAAPGNRRPTAASEHP